MDLGLEALVRASAAERDLHRPEFFKLALPDDRKRLEDLLKRTPGIAVFDELHGQLRELVRALQPTRRFTPTELDKAAHAHLAGVDPAHYGTWVYYPWGPRLVHLLDAGEFALVRTDRNRNKITREEQAVLADTRVGVVGLSVGQSICLTMALERSFGELRIADFDTLELSNLNRIRDGVHALGLRKTVNVAREVAEIDPYLKVTLFNEGLTRDNIERFLTEGGKLDILVDECDSVDIKILCRQHAKAHRIPVVMDTSDRGMLDVERFDLEPDRPILHGLVDHLDLDAAAKARTNEEKLPYVLPIAGMEQLSPRMKASMMEIERTVTTWPQLATSVVLGGAISGDVCRRIALGQSKASGRWYLDMDVLTDGAPPSAEVTLSPAPPALSVDAMLAMAAEAARNAPGSAKLTTEQVRSLVDAGAWAPSAGNNQPWQFLEHEGRLYVFLDEARGHSRLDRQGLVPTLSMGCCVENIAVRAAGTGLGAIVREYPLGTDSPLVAEISAGPTNPAREPLDALIGMRCSNRKKGDGSPLTTQEQGALLGVLDTSAGCRLHLITDPAQLNGLADAIGFADRVRVLNPIGHAELFKHEVRWTPEEAARTADGLDLATMELSLAGRTAMRIASDPAAIKLLHEWGGGAGFNSISGDAVRTSSAVMLLTAPDPGRNSMLRVGRAAERLWLQATALGLGVHPVSSPFFLSHQVRWGGGAGFSDGERAALLRNHEDLVRLLALGQEEPMFMARLSRAAPPSARSVRRPLSHMFHALSRSTT